VKPILQALVLAERIYIEKTEKKIIAGTFNQINIAQTRPMQVQLPDGSTQTVQPAGYDPGCPWIYISLTDVIDDTGLTLQFVNVAKNEVIFQTSFAVKSPSRLTTIEIVAALPPMAVLAKEVGDFSFDLLWSGEILGSHRLLVRQAEGIS
jgi:hypothetical protein